MGEDKVILYFDPNVEMMKLVVNGQTLKIGNYWDFNFEEDLGSVLKKLDIKLEKVEYTSND